MPGGAPWRGCRQDGFGIDAEGLDLVTFYSRNLVVPARRGAGDPEVLRGKEVFHRTGCTACHRPKLVTHRLKDQPEQSFQTDLALPARGHAGAMPGPRIPSAPRRSPSHAAPAPSRWCSIA